MPRESSGQKIPYGGVSIPGLATPSSQTGPKVWMDHGVITCLLQLRLALVEPQQSRFLMPHFPIAAQVTELANIRIFSSDHGSLAVGIGGSTLYYSYPSNEPLSGYQFEFQVHAGLCISGNLYLWGCTRTHR